MIARSLEPYMEAAILLHLMDHEVSKDAVASAFLIFEPVIFTADKIDNAIRSLTKHTVNSADIVESLDLLAEKRFLKKHSDSVADDFYEIGADSIKLIDGEFGRAGSVCQKSRKLGANWLSSAFQNAEKKAEIYEKEVARGDKVGSVTVTQSESPRIPAADRVVTLDHNSDPYRQAIESLDKIVAQVRADNQADGFTPEEKEAGLASLVAGRKLLDATSVRVRAIYETLIVPAKWAAKVFASTSIQQLAIGLIHHLSTWLGMQ